MKTIAALMIGAAFLVSVARADDAAPPATQPTAQISPDAQKLIDQIHDAYAKLHALNLAGTMMVQTQIEGSSPEQHTSDFTSTFVPPNKFRHEMKGDVLLGSTGQKLYTFQSDENSYSLADAPKDRVASKELPKEFINVLQLQNPSLVLAISKNAADELALDVTEISRAEDTTIGDVKCPTLKLVQNDKSLIQIMADPETHLLRRAIIDLTGPLKQRRAELSQALVTIDYTKIAADEPSKDEMFAWAPPPGAKDSDAMASARPLDDVQASDLEGKPAPDFKLNGMDGKPVALADLKGKVVIVDFWATWCGPCRLSLPHLDELYKAEKEKGLVVYAVDEQEAQDAVAGFVKQTGLSVPVLLDSEGKAGAQFGASAIPETVLIGKDGTIKKVFVGFDPEKTPGELKAAVEAAMK